MTGPEVGLRQTLLGLAVSDRLCRAEIGCRVFGDDNADAGAGCGAPGGVGVPGGGGEEAPGGLLVQ